MDSKVFKKATLLAAISTTVQAITWEALSLVSLLAAVEVIKPSTDVKVLSKPTYVFGLNLLKCYFPGEYSDSCCKRLVMPGGGMLAISVVYLLMSLVWLCGSTMVLMDLLSERKRVSILTKIWSTITITVCIFDFCVVILFGVDYGIMSSAKDKNDLYICTSSHLSVAGFLMSLAARGYLLWCINLATAIWLFKASNTVVVSRRASLDSNYLHNEPWRSFDSRVRDQDVNSRTNNNAFSERNTTSAIPHQPFNTLDDPRSAPAHIQRGGLAQRMGPQHQSFSYESGNRRPTSLQQNSAPQPLGSLFSQQRPNSHLQRQYSHSSQQSQSPRGGNWQQPGGGQRGGSRSYDNRGYDGGRGRLAY